jgi:hypothetical protein
MNDLQPCDSENNHRSEAGNQLAILAIAQFFIRSIYVIMCKVITGFLLDTVNCGPFLSTKERNPIYLKKAIHLKVHILTSLNLIQSAFFQNRILNN